MHALKSFREKSLSVIIETLELLLLVQGKRKLTRRGKLGSQRTVDEAVQILWKVIDEAKMYMENSMLTPEEKRRWAKTLADTIGVLNKLLASQGECKRGGFEKIFKFGKLC